MKCIILMMTIAIKIEYKNIVYFTKNYDVVLFHVDSRILIKQYFVW